MESEMLLGDVIHSRVRLRRDLFAPNVQPKKSELLHCCIAALIPKVILLQNFYASCSYAPFFDRLPVLV